MLLLVCCLNIVKHVSLHLDILTNQVHAKNSPLLIFSSYTALMDNYNLHVADFFQSPHLRFTSWEILAEDTHQPQTTPWTITNQLCYLSLLGQSWRRNYISLLTHRRLQPLNFAHCACFVGSLGGGPTIKKSIPS